jgi:hypothetical protein
MKTNFDLVKDRPVVMDGVDMMMPYKIFPTVKDFVDFLNLTVEEKILDEDEKRYIKNIVRPFRDKVISICKREYDDIYEYITIIYQDKNQEATREMRMYLPNFRANTMYTGMSLDKHYTLEDLGIIFKN